MDPIGHLLIGSAVLAMAPAEAGTAIAVATLVGAEIPDSDYVVKWLKGGPAYLHYHRGPTHGPVGVLALSALTAWVVGFFAVTPFVTLFLWALAGALSHVLFDVTNNYGTQALWPFSSRRLALDWSPIVDLWLVAIIVAGWMYYWAWPGASRQTVFTWVWAVIGVYYVARWRLHDRAATMVMRQFPNAGWQGGARPQNEAIRSKPVFSVHPSFLSLSTWRYVVQDGQQFKTGLVSLRRGVVTEPKVSAHHDDAVVSASMQAPLLGVFLNFARHPRAEYTQDSLEQYTVRWTDMRFEVDGYSPFSAEIHLDKELYLLDEQLGPQKAPGKDYILKRWQEERGQFDEKAGILD